MKPQQIREILANLKQKTGSEGEVLVRYGDMGHEFFIVLEGYVSIYIP